MGLGLRKEKHYTYADYLRWPDDARYELIEGEAFLMAPAPLIAHREVAGELFRQVANQLDGKPCRPYIAPIGVLPGVSIAWDALVARLPKPEY